MIAIDFMLVSFDDADVVVDDDDELGDDAW